MSWSGKINTSIIGSLLLMSLGCGGGGDPKPNISPLVSVQDQEATEGSEIAITATATDEDGQITSYLWSQVSGESVEFAGGDTSTVSFIAPDVTENTDLIFNVLVTDDQGATASADVTITVSANVTTLTLVGIATDSPISGANITYLLGNQTFTATADENGLYSIEISVDDSLLNEQVIATAKGPETESIVKLRSLLGDFASIVTYAGEDSILEKHEMFNVNITHVSTAIAALMEQANGATEISSQAEFDNAAKSYDGSLVLPLATAIKLVVDFSESNEELQLPNSVNNTDEFVSNLNLVSEYLNTVQNDFAEQYSEALESVINDEQAIASGAANQNIPLADSYFFISADGALGDGRMLLNADESGSLQDYSGSTAITWSVNEAGITLDYVGGPKVLNTYVEYIEGVPVDVELISLGKNVKWLLQTESADQLMITETTYRRYPNGELPDEAPTTSERFHNAVKTNGVLSAADILQMNTDYVFPVPQVSEVVENSKSEGTLFGELEYLRSSTKMFFTGNVEQGGNVTVTSKALNGEGAISNNSQVMQWNIASDGHLVISGEQTYDYAFLLAKDNNTPFVNVQFNDGSTVTAMGDHALAKGQTNWTNESAVGIYDLAWDFFAPLNYFWVEVNADGTALTVSTYDSNENGQLEDNEFSQMPGLWQINANGNLVVRRYRNNTLIDGTFNYCTPSTWDPADSDACLLYHERNWDLYQVKANGEHHMEHLHRFYDDATRAWMEDPSVAGHILGYATSDIRYWLKVEQRPVELPISQLSQSKTNSRPNDSRVD